MQSTERRVLLIDAGNTRVKGALYENGRIVPGFSVETAKVIRSRELPLIKASDVAAASVVPEVTELLKRIYPGALLISKSSKLPFKLNYRGNIGADRLANMAGALSYSESFIVVNCGTATVIDVVVNREFLGGYILPGIKTMAECLNRRGALLPEVKLKKLRENPGSSTEECIKAGISVSTLGAIKEVKEKFNLPLFITGGLGRLVSEILRKKFFENLTFEGIYRIYRTERGEIPPK